MKIEKSIFAVDSHTMGEATRVVVGGVPSIPGKTMPEKKEYLEEHMDYLRTSIMLEPRGHNEMFGSIITQPTMDEADLGVIFMDGGGYLNMCGHGSIGTATVAVEEGIVPVEEPVTTVMLEAPAGLVKAKVKVEDGKAKQVSLENVPAFLYKRDIEVEVPGIGKVRMDISFGGSFFAIVKAEDLGVEICPANSQKLIEVGMNVIKAVNDRVEIQHPTLSHIKTVDLCEIYGPAKSPDATLQNAVVFGQGQLDRSPCGTGTSAKLATLYAKGKLKINEKFVYESVLKTKFVGRVLKETKVGDYDAIIPEITGAAYVTGHNQLFIDPDDPLKHGFILK
ncbi:proline racemase [Clostridium fermenticellae]|uniref:Proline racemase n=1 Tax=Clostridium fermenticellae TaxID=2068654 RepID=A0A386H3T3_9CLOT|nr:proline racemase [Clostridium fermenticellae]AYD39151.1 proline racemase [Clostridium fermenticellae]AYD40352.1 proline racemase [Clostridium fermenticellae]